MPFTDSGVSATELIQPMGPPVLVTAGEVWQRGDVVGWNGSAWMRSSYGGGSTENRVRPFLVAGIDAQSGAISTPVYVGGIVQGERYSGGTIGAPLYLSPSYAGRVSENPGHWFHGTPQAHLERLDKQVGRYPVGFVIAVNAVFLCPALLGEFWGPWQLASPGNIQAITA